MSTTIRKIFDEFNLQLSGIVSWNQEVESTKCGLYFVTVSNDPDNLVCWDKPEFDIQKIQKWISLVEHCWKNITVDGRIASAEDILDRLNALWLQDETILYIGKAGPNRRRTLKKRVNEYYDTKLGCNKKHAGGNWINTLTKLDELYVFYSEFEEQEYNMIESSEEKLIEYFSENVSDSTRKSLYDKANCFPFANKELYKKLENTKIRKNHGLKNQTVDCGNNWKK